MMLKIVLDTNVLVSGLITPRGVPAQIIAAINAGEVFLCYCEQIIAEYTDVLHRPKFGFKKEDVSNMLESILELGVPVLPKASAIPMPDESDRVFYDTAMCAGAVLVTGNTRHYPTDSRILTPAAFQAKYLLE